MLMEVMPFFVVFLSPPWTYSNPLYLFKDIIKFGTCHLLGAEDVEKRNSGHYQGLRDEVLNG